MSEHEQIQFFRNVPFVGKNGHTRYAKMLINAKRREDGNWFIMMICDFLKSQDHYGIPDHDVMEKINAIHDDVVRQIKGKDNA